jgi:hypothetical protein
VKAVTAGSYSLPGTHQLTGLIGGFCALLYTQARACGADQRLIKQVLSEGNSWENARPPFEVNIAAEAVVLHSQARAD